VEIVFLQRSQRWGGSVRSLLILADTLVKRGHDIAMGVYGIPPFVQSYAEAGVSVDQIRDHVFEQTTLFRSAAVLRLRRGTPTLLSVPRLALDTGPSAYAVRRYLRRRNPSLVHTNEHLRQNRAEILGAAGTGIPVISHIRGVHRLNAADRYLAQFVQRFIAVSKAAAEPYLESGVDATRIAVIANATVLPRSIGAAERAMDRQGLGIGNDDVCVATAGRLIHQKGNGLAIRSIAHLASQGLPVKLLILGDGPDEPSLRSLAASLGIADRVRFGGWSLDPMRSLQLADVVLLSATAPEGFPRVLVEGQACGLPVVSTPAGGAGEVFDPGISGLLASSATVEGIAEVLKPLVCDAGLREQFGRAGRLHAEGAFSVHRHADSVESVYETALADAGRRATRNQRG